jgi:hypothetical protein
MAFSDALAVFGAATGLIGTMLGVMAFLRDRARLFVRLDTGWESAWDTGWEGAWVIYVVNAGRQPVAIVHVGLRRQAPDSHWGSGERREGDPNYSIEEAIPLLRPWKVLSPKWRNWQQYEVWDALPESAEPLVLAPGGLARFTFSETRPDDMLIPIQAFAMDWRGRRALSSDKWVTSPGARLRLIADRSTRPRPEPIPSSE